MEEKRGKRNQRGCPAPPAPPRPQGHPVLPVQGMLSPVGAPPPPRRRLRSAWAASSPSPVQVPVSLVGGALPPGEQEAGRAGAGVSSFPLTCWGLTGAWSQVGQWWTPNPLPGSPVLCGRCCCCCWGRGPGLEVGKGGKSTTKPTEAHGIRKRSSSTPLPARA